MKNQAGKTDKNWLTIDYLLLYNSFVSSEFTWTTVQSRHRPEGGKHVSEVKIKDNESLDSALRRFKRNCAKAGIMGEVRKREHYDKPSVKRKKKSEAARKRKYL